MNASNKFTVVGFICKDAEVRNFEKSSLARFGVSIKTTEKKGGVEITSSSIQSFETWIKNDNQALLDLLKKGKRKEVTSKQKRPVTRMARTIMLSSLSPPVSQRWRSKRRRRQLSLLSHICHVCLPRLSFWVVLD